MSRTLFSFGALVALGFSMISSRGPLGANEGELQGKWGGVSSPNMVSECTGLPSDLEEIEPLWELRLGTHQYSIPTIDRGRIYIGINDHRIDRPGTKTTGGGILRCIDQASGQTIWQISSPRYFEGVRAPYHFNQWKSGFCSGPVVDGDRVYVVGGRGEIICLDRKGQANGNAGPFVKELEYMGVEPASGMKLGPKDGDIIWIYNLLTELDVIPHDVCGSTLLLYDGLLYACTSNGLDDRHDKIANPLAPSLIVLDSMTGRLVAKEAEKISSRLLHGHWSSPSLGHVDGKPLVFFGGGDGILYAFKPAKRPAAGAHVQDLVKVWAYDCNPPDYRMRDGVPVPYSKHNRRRSDGPSEVIATPVFHNGRVYVAIGQSPLHGKGIGYLSCVDAASGTKVWGSRLVDRTLSTVSIAAGLLYIVDTSGNLHCFDADTGERHWWHHLGPEIWSASTFVASGNIYVGTEENTFWVLKAAKEKQIVSRKTFKSMPITVTAAAGVLYVPTQRRLIAIPGKSVPTRSGAAPATPR